jgi:hypothetical protein
MCNSKPLQIPNNPERRIGKEAERYALEYSETRQEAFDKLLILCYAIGLKDDPEAKESDNLSRHVRYGSRKRRAENRGSDPTHFRNLAKKED